MRIAIYPSYIFTDLKHSDQEKKPVKLNFLKNLY